MFFLGGGVGRVRRRNSVIMSVGEREEPQSYSILIQKHGEERKATPARRPL